MNLQCPHGDLMAAWSCISQHCHSFGAMQATLKRALEATHEFALLYELRLFFKLKVLPDLKCCHFPFIFSFYCFQPVISSIYILRPTVYWYVVHLHLPLCLMCSQWVPEHLGGWGREDLSEPIIMCPLLPSKENYTHLDEVSTKMIVFGGTKTWTKLTLTSFWAKLELQDIRETEAPEQKQKFIIEWKTSLSI